MDTIKYCNGCKQTLEISAFSPHFKHGKWVVRSRCKKCEAGSARQWRKENPDKHRAAKTKWYKANPDAKTRMSWRRFARKIGVDPNALIAAIEAHNGCCDICGGQNADGERLNKDHCHETGSLRGFLCDNCNQGLGKFKDNTERLQKAIEYLRQKPLVERQ